MIRQAAFACTVAMSAVVLAAQPTTRAIAVTFDDLPYSGVGSDDFTRDAQRVSDSILRVLAAHRAPAVGFVNENKLTDAPRIAVLKQWADAGIVLGNHTYSHPDLNTLTVDAIREEIVRGEPVTRRLMEPHQPYPLFFRHPQTHTGDTREKKEAIEAFLAARGYRIAPHTIENSDYVFQVPYMKARQTGDAALVKKLMDTYVEFTFAATTFAEEVAPKIFGRDIPQTLLIHSNDVTADGLERLLAGYESRGYRFVSLDEAMRDSAYQTKDTYVTRFGPTWLFRWSRSLGKSVSFSYDPPEWVMEMYSAK